MTQYIDIQYQEKAESKPLNQRFLDISGPCILQGYRTIKGTKDFSLTIDKGGYNSNVAITPSGARVEETSVLVDVVSTKPNDTLPTRRVDSLYLVYKYGTSDAVATYEIVEGTNIPAENPNRKTHLLLAYIYIAPDNAPIRPSDIVQVPYGFSKLEVAGSSMFHGPVTIDGELTINGNVNGSAPGIGGGSGGQGTIIERLPTPIIAKNGQTDFTLPSAYTMNTHTLFVYKNAQLLPPSDWMEVTNVSFRLYDPCKSGDKIWAFWYVGLNVYTVPEHNHDDLYYRKYEIANRAVRYLTDYFAGPNGREIHHNLGTDNYVVIAVTPTEKTNAVGQISVDKRTNQIIIYNDGSYRGKFDLSYMMKPPFPEVTEEYQALDYAIESNRYNEKAKVYEEVIYRRRNGTIFVRTTLFQTNADGKFTRCRVEYFNNDGKQVYQEKIWALTYDTNNKIKLKNRIS